MIQLDLSCFTYWLDGFWREYGDSRVEFLPMMTTFGPVLSILTFYTLFVLVIGPRMMKNREPFSLRPILLFHNFTTSLGNLFGFLVVVGNFKELLIQVTNVNFNTHNLFSPLVEHKYIMLSYFYFLSKLTDLLDTVFIVLRKKQSQITLLHLYHHFSVPFFGWIYFRLNALCVMMSLFAFLNCFVHTLMYGYYGLAAIGPHMRKYLWWKRYITQAQILQFVILGIHSVYFLLFQQGYSKFFIFNYLLNVSLYLILFCQFYCKTYHREALILSVKALAMRVRYDFAGSYNRKAG